MKQEKENNLLALNEVSVELRKDFKEARDLRLKEEFTPSDKEYFMTRCKQAEGIVSATKNALENIKELEKEI